MGDKNQKYEDRTREIGQLVVMMNAAIDWIQALGFETIAIEAMRVRLSLHLEMKCGEKV